MTAIWSRGDKVYGSYEEFKADSPYDTGQPSRGKHHAVRCSIKNEWEGRTTPALPCLRDTGHEGPHRTSSNDGTRFNGSKLGHYPGERNRGTRPNITEQI